MKFFISSPHPFFRGLLLFLFLVSLESTSLRAETTSTFPSPTIDHDEIGELESNMDENNSIRDFKPWLEGATGTGNWFGLRDQLVKKGIELGFSSINEVWGNTTGGMKTGSVSTTVLQMATAIDLEKLIDWKGGSFYSRWLYLAGQDPGTNLAGDLFGVSNIGGYSTLRNIELWLQQNILDDKISLRAGQLVADSEFVISDYGALFINNTYGWPAFIYASIPNGGPAYPIGAPGVRLKFQPNDQFSFKAAAFQGNVYAQNVNNHGFNWNLNANQGYFYLTEAAYRYECILPGQVKAGSWFSSSTFPNLSNPGDSFSGNYGLYGIIDQMVYRCSPKSCAKEPSSLDAKKVVEEKNDRGLRFFSRIAFEPEDRNILNFYCDTGLNFKGLLPKRGQDLFGIACGYGLFGNDGVNAIQQSQGTALANTTFDIEMTYQAALTPWLSLQPDLQYIIHPRMTQTYPNALVIGLRASVTF